MSQPPRHRFVVFGDSFSDIGRNLEDTSHDPRYYKLRYSDGPIYLDHLAADGVCQEPTVDDVFAYGSATTDSDWCQGVSGASNKRVPGVLQQIRQLYLNNVNRPDADCVIIWAGINDVYFSLETNGNIPDVEIIVNNIINAIHVLRENGSATILIGLMLDLATFPGFQQLFPDKIEDLSAATARFNQLLRSKISEIGCLSFDPNEIVDKPTLSSTDGPSSSIFIWDDWHPTTKTHRAFADLIAAALQN